MSRIQRRAAVLTLGLVVALTLSFLLLSRSADQQASPPNPTLLVETDQDSSVSESELEPAVEPRTHDGVFPLHGVIDNPDCHMRSGEQETRGLAVMLLPDGEISHFKVVDADGTVFEGSLPFVANHLRLGRRVDGTILVGFGDLRLNSRVFREEDTAEPVHIYEDGNLIYARQKVWDFDISRDGAAFFTAEPYDGESARLRIEHLDWGVVREYDLGTRMARHGFDIHATPMFLQSSDEVMLKSYSTLPHMFYPVDDRPVRSVDQVQRGGFTTRFLSRNTAYYAELLDPDREWWRIGRREYRWIDDEMQWTDTWIRELALHNFGIGLYVSDDGNHVIVEAWNRHVFNGTTGVTEFAFPTEDAISQRPGMPSDAALRRRVVSEAYRNARVERLAGVWDPSKAPDPGGHGNLEITDGLLTSSEVDFFRTVEDCRTYVHDQYDECVSKVSEEGLFRRDFYYVYDMATITPQASPDRRIERNRDHSCSGAWSAQKKVEIVDGRYRYINRW